METRLRGAVAASDVKLTIGLIRALCTDLESAEFREWVRVYNAPKEAGLAAHSLRLVQSLMSPLVEPSPAEAWAPLTLCTLGPLDRRTPWPVERRTVTRVRLDKGAPQALAALDCAPSFEFVRRGVRIRTRTGLVVAMYNIERLLRPGEPQHCVSLNGTDKPDVLVVEISSTKGATPEELLEFMEKLGPAVVLPPKQQRR